MHQVIIDAIARRRCIVLRYDGFDRVVEPHAYGLTKEGNRVVRVWQVRGGSVSNEQSGWKLLRTDEVRTAHSSLERAEAPRPGYKRGDAVMVRIIAEV